MQFWNLLLTCCPEYGKKVLIFPFLSADIYHHSSCAYYLSRYAKEEAEAEPSMKLSQPQSLSLEVVDTEVGFFLDDDTGTW